MNYKNAIEQKKLFYTKKKLNEKCINQLLTFLTIFFAVIAIIVYGTVNQYYSAEVVGHSMAPTINAHSYFDYNSTQKNQIAYYTTYKKPQKGDIIIVDYELAGITEVDAIKRLIAVGGDTICYYNGEILVNGEAIDEPYLKQSYNLIKKTQGVEYANYWKNNGYETSRSKFNNFCEAVLNKTYNKTTFSKNYETDYSGSIKYSEVIDGYVLTIPENFVYFLGDNRAGSRDSSEFGPLEKKYMLVKVDYVVDYGTNIFSAIWQNFLKQF